MRSILFTIISAAALASSAAVDMGEPDGGRAAGFGPDGDVYDDRGPFPSEPFTRTPVEVTQSGGLAAGFGPDGDVYDGHGPFPGTPFTRTPTLATVSGAFASGFGPDGDIYDDHGPLPGTPFTRPTPASSEAASTGSEATATASS